MDMCWLLYVAGLDTVHAGLGHSFRYLGEHTDKRDELVADPSLIPAAVEELLRWHSWVNPPRTVRQDCEFNGIQLRKGEKIAALAVMADRDPRGVRQPRRRQLPSWAQYPLGIRRGPAPLRRIPPRPRGSASPSRPG